MNRLADVWHGCEDKVAINFFYVRRRTSERASRTEQVLPTFHSLKQPWTSLVKTIATTSRKDRNLLLVKMEARAMR